MPAEPVPPEPTPDEPTHAPPLPPEATQQLPPDEHAGHAEPAVAIPAGVPPEAAVLTAPPPPPPPGAPPGVEPPPWQPPRPYPVSLDLTGPERLSRLSSFFRIILMIPLAIFVAILGGSFTSFSFLLGTGGGLITFILFVHWLTVLARGRPVGWAWGTIVAMQRFILRSYSYFFLLTDRYPPFEGDWYLQFEVEKPARIRRRQLFFWKTIASIPHFVILSALWFGVAVCEVFGWFAILFTGKFPRGMRNFVVDWMRWYARVGAYWMSLRDEFPPYSLSANAGPGSRTSLLVSAFLGAAFLAGIIVLIVALVASVTGSVSTDVNYSSLQTSAHSPTIDVSNVEVTLTGADDDYDFPDNLYIPRQGYRFVELTLSIRNRKITDLRIDYSDFDLSVKVTKSDLDSSAPRYTFRTRSEPIFLSVDDAVPPLLVAFHALRVIVVFEVPNGTTPDELKYQPNPGLKKAKFVFHELAPDLR